MKKFLIGSALAALAGAAMAQAPAAPTPAPMAQQHRMMADRVQTRDEVVAKVREHFAKMDTNRDGFIAQDEMQAMRGQHGERMGKRGGRDGQRMAMRQGPMGDPGAMFDRLDANRDGMISRDEFAKGREMRVEKRVVMNGDGAPRAEGKRGQRMQRMGGGKMGGGMMDGRMMKMADANNDGRVSLQEAQDSAVRHFDMMDTNRDGRITPDERKGMHMKLRGERAPKAS